MVTDPRSGLEPNAPGDLPPEHLRRAVARVLADAPRIAVAYAYGSRVAGRPRPGSDLDLMFVLRDDEAPLADPLLPERLAARIASELGASVEIDAHLARDLPLGVRGRALTEGTLLYETDPVRRVAFETSTRRLYFDFLPFIERDAREALLAGG